MSASPDLLFQNVSLPQGSQQPTPNTIASAATIAPQNALTVISGTTSVTTITPPITGAHILWFRWTTGTANGFNTGGNIAIAYTTITNRPVALLYDPNTALYYPMAIS